jgi:cytochrome oxidase assembly protein ShyY1
VRSESPSALIPTCDVNRAILCAFHTPFLQRIETVEWDWPISPPSAARQWFVCDTKSMSAALGLHRDPTVIIELTASPSGTDAGGINHGARSGLLLKQPEDYLEFYVTPFKHKVYATTWFSLSAFGSIMTFFMFRRGRVAMV